MTQSELKELKAIGAELGAAKAENEKLREVLSRIANLPMYQCSTENDYRLSAAKAMAVAALSQQPEPTDTFTAVDMATAAAQGFRDGQAAVEPAPAQDERETVSHDAELYGIGFMVDGVRVSPDRVTIQYARPAQTEQQPAGVVLPPQCTDKSEHVKYRKGWNSCLSEVFRLNRAHTATQPEQSGKFAMHQRVRKTSGSEWQGRICGTYSTSLTPEGYAVESEAHAGSVQIYPAKALEAVE